VTGDLCLERRLAAILAADVVNYSRLMGEDEARTLAALAELRQKFFEPVVAARGGSIIKRMGDGWIVEYPNISDATASAIEVQEGLSNHDVIRLRIGVHIGDVTFQDDDVYGDGINVAARLEALAEPAQVLISDTAHQSLDGKAAGKFGGGETHELKNIARPVAVWRWPAGSDVMAPAQPAFSLPDKPSIAVLPFDNMSGDPKQEYFSDGMTEDIITALSRLRWLFVTARNSSFTYKGQAVDVKQVGREMGVRYVLEGSIRKAGNRIRVTAQLIEAKSGNHIWAERYDRELADIFELQDELTEAISGNVDAELAGSERQQAYKKSTTDLDAWDLYQRGMWHYYKTDKGNMAEARRLLQRASDRAPEFSNAYTGLANIAFNETILGYTPDRTATLEQGLRDAERALMLDDRDGYNHIALGRICTMLGERDRAILALETSIDLNPSSAMSYYGLGFALYWFGRAEEAIPLFGRAMRLSPHDPQLWAFHLARSFAYSMLGEFDLATVDSKAAIQVRSDEFWPHLGLVVACSLQGNSEGARNAYDRARKIYPAISAAYVESLIGTLHPPYLKHWLDALHQVGLPGD